MPSTHRLLSTNTPWVHLASLKPGQTVASLLAPPLSLQTHELAGRSCATKEGLLKAAAKAFDFPDYFDPNWDAFEECLCDLEWRPAEGYLLVFNQAHLVLSRAPEDWETLISILRSVGKHWGTKQNDRPARPFHSIFAVEAGKKTARKDWHIPLWKAR